MVDIPVVCEECTLDDILLELPNRVAKPIPSVKGKNFKTIFNQFTDSLKDIHLQYTCLDVSSIALALGTNVGNAYVYQRKHRKIVNINCETKYVPALCIRLALGSATVAFGHESGSVCVGLVDPPQNVTYNSLTAQGIHNSAITCLEWSFDGLILYAGDKNGKISMSVVKISEGILQTAIILTEESAVVQLSYAEVALLISTNKRTALWSFETELLIQVGEKERKVFGAFGGCFITDPICEPTKKLYAARPGLRIWTSDANGKVSSTSVFKTLLGNKPPLIKTLSKKDKFNSNGQFGKLLMFHSEYVVTWDSNHIWVLDIEQGVVIGCHSNLGKICSVSVCGHEIFVLLYQTECFLIRLVLTTERVAESPCLDAVVAGSIAPGNYQPSGAISYWQETGKQSKDAMSILETGAVVESGLQFTSPINLQKENVEEQSKDCEECDLSTTVETLTSVGVPNEHEIPRPDIFDKINAISIEDHDDDIVFTAAKKRKKKKKAKQTSKEGEGIGHQNTNIKSREEDGAIKDEPTQVQFQTSGSTLVQQTEDSIKPHVKRSHSLETIEPRENEFSDSALEKQTNDKRLPKPNKLNIVVPQEKEILESNEYGNNKVIKSDQSSGSVKEKQTEVTNVNRFPEQIISESKKREEVSEVENKLKVKNESMATSHEYEKANDEKQKAQFLTNTTSTTVKENTTSFQHDLTEPIDIYRNTSEHSGFESEEEMHSNTTKAGIDSNSSKLPPKDNHVPLHSDTWSGRSLPTTQSIEHVSVTQKYVFCVNTKGAVYFCDPYTTSNGGWEKADFKAKQLYASSKCDFICGIEDGKAFVRGGISDESPVGKSSHEVHKAVVLLSICATYTWALCDGNRLFCADTARLKMVHCDVDENMYWKFMGSVPNLNQIVCYDDFIWARTNDGTLQFSEGNNVGKKASWKTEDKKAKWLHMTCDGTLWTITLDDVIWFKPQASTEEVWYQVTLGQYIIDDPSLFESTYNFISSVGSAYRNARTSEYLRQAAKGLLQSTKDMALSLFRDGGSPKQICCDPHSGVWLLDTKNALHACRGHVTGGCWEMVCPTGTARSSTWRDFTTGLANYVWAIQPTGDLTCFHPKGPSYNVEGPSNRDLNFVSGSPHGLWCFRTQNNTKVYIRDGISKDYPQGFAWVSLHLRKQEICSIKHLSVGKVTVWSVDNDGQVWVRVGNVGGEECRGLTQAWLPIDNPEKIVFANVEVNSTDLIVWGTDVHGVVYARDGVKETFMVGEQWRQVKGVNLKSLCLSRYLVYGISTAGELVCRYGVSEMNCVGDYWKKVPGSYSKISVDSAGELWAIDEEEKLHHRKIKFLTFVREEHKACQNDLDAIKENDAVDEDEWEMI